MFLKMGLATLFFLFLSTQMKWHKIIAVISFVKQRKRGLLKRSQLYESIILLCIFMKVQASEQFFLILNFVKILIYSNVFQNQRQKVQDS